MGGRDMKAVEYWSYEGFNIVIEAEYKKDGVRLPEGRKDVVHFRSTIYNPYTRKEEEYKDGYVHEHSINTSKKWYHKKKYETVNISKAFEDKVIEIANENIDHIKILVTEKRVTDGLPDSLKGL